MNMALWRLLQNTRSGLKLVLFRPVGRDEFSISIDQLVLLYLLEILLGLMVDFVTNQPNPTFNIYAFTLEGFSAAVLLLAVYLAARFVFKQQIITTVMVILLSMTPGLVIIWTATTLALQASSIHEALSPWLYYGYFIWILAITFRSLAIAGDHPPPRTFASTAILFVVWLLPTTYFGAYSTFWYASEPDAEDPYRAYRDLDAEALFYLQPELVDTALSNIKPDRPGITDVYFVGVGAYAREDVFLKETLYAETLFKQRFDADGRTLPLINHLSTRNTLPLATSHNLKRALQKIGQRMNREEDILVLYMTSHGAKSHELAVDFWPLPLNDITPDMVRQYLDEAGIKWRVVMVSACYSGGFIEPLKTPYTAIATAASPDTASFGCSNKREFTYFGEALLKDGLNEGLSLPAAFNKTRTLINKREEKEKLSASKPQFFIGDDIQQLLETLDHELRVNGY